MSRPSTVRTFCWAMLCAISLPGGVASAGGGPGIAYLDHLYWVENGAIRRATVSVGDPGLATVLSAPASQATDAIAVDRDLDLMFWGAAGQYEGLVRRASLSGEGITDLVVLGDGGAGGVAFDHVSGKLYFTDPSDCIPDCGSIRRINPDGSGEELILQQDTPITVAVYPTGGRVCWGDSHNSWIRCSDLDGSDILTVVPDVVSHGIAIDDTNGMLYWTDSGNNRIRRSNMDGTDVEDLVTGLGTPWGIAVDATTDLMFWTEFAAGKVVAARLDGSNPTDLYTGLDSPKGIAHLPAPGGDVPATSTRGLIALTALLLVVSTIALLRRRGRIPH